MSDLEMPAPGIRMTATERTQHVIAAATAAFAAGGYAGTTTDQVARRANVSQPYVLRLFGSKRDLFLAVAQNACDHVQQAFRASVANLPDAADHTRRLAALAEAYLKLARDRDQLLVMMHAFLAASDPVIGPAIRATMLDVYRLVCALGHANPAQARDFLARGMLINTLVALDMPNHRTEDSDADELVSVTFLLPELDE
ncbi:MAG: TetR/AcrR family transcriptional regulator [Mycobacterium sp.]